MSTALYTPNMTRLLLQAFAFASIDVGQPQRANAKIRVRESGCNSNPTKTPPPVHGEVLGKGHRFVHQATNEQPRSQ